MHSKQFHKLPLSSEDVQSSELVHHAKEFDEMVRRLQPTQSDDTSLRRQLSSRSRIAEIG